MNHARLLPLSLALCAFLLAACGNKADLFMPPPPEDDEVAGPWEGEDPFAEDVDEAATAEPVPPVPTATGTEPARPAIPPIDDDDSDPPPAEPVDDDE